MLSDPELAFRSCEDCQKWVYELEGPKKGKRAQRGGKDVPRGKTKPPCWQCPKKSPEQAHKYEPTSRTIRALQLYWESQTIQIPLSATDSILRRNLATVAKVVTEHRDSTNVDVLVTALAAMIIR